jgi:hypothetical protein
MKPAGITFGMGANGPTLGVTRPSRAEDKTYEAVEEAILEGWTIERFLCEAREAWLHHKQEEVKTAEDEWTRILRKGTPA